MIAQLFNFDCTKLPGAVTKLSHLKKGQQCFHFWDDYASPELLEYIGSSQSAPGIPVGFKGDVCSDLFSWGIIAWELLTGELPFQDTEAKLAGRCQPWPSRLAPQVQMAGTTFSPAAIQLIQACLELVPSRRPDLETLRRSFP